MSDERRGAENAGHEDQRMVEQAKSKQPITEAVREALAKKEPVSVYINTPDRAGQIFYIEAICAESDNVEGLVWRVNVAERLDHPHKQREFGATPADAATALRLVADALSPAEMELTSGWLRRKRIYFT